MGRPLQKLGRFFRELKRRHVYRVGAAYLVTAFVVLQLADLAAGAFGLPSWFEPMIWVFCGLGLPIALVVAWGFELTPEGVRRTPEDKPDGESRRSDHADSPRPLEGPAVSGSSSAPSHLTVRALLGLGVLVMAFVGGWYLVNGGEGENPESGERTVAVLPFQVSGPETETWREGMVTMVSTGLDGAARLRAIPDQTVLAAWEEAARSDRPGGEGLSLATARKVGAEFAVIGQAAQVGRQLLLSADVYRTRSGDRLGQAEVRGAPDSVASLTDSLTRRILGILLEKGGGGLPAVDLARVTTASRTALRAYLEGERHFRAGDFEAAVGAYRRAIRADSTFALAYARLSNAAGWGGVTGARAPILRAHALSHQLPTRERRLVQAMYDWIQTGDRIAAADTLRRLSEAYPDDPTVWYNLGEVLWHGQIPNGWPEADSAFQRAVELDPGVAAYHHHLVDLAFSLRRDSALVARRISVHPGREDRKRLFRLTLDLVFGSPAARRAALERAQRVPVPNDWALWLMLRHPLDGDTEDRVLRILWNRDDLREEADPEIMRHLTFALVLNSLEHGHIAQAATDAQEVGLHPTLTACYLAGAMAIGVPVPDSVAAAYLEPSNLGPESSLRRLKCAGIYLVENGRGEELSGLESRIRDAPVAGPWPTIGLDRSAESVLELLKGYRAWRAGELEAAADLLSDASPWDWWAGTGAIWRGDLERDLGRLEKAEGWYLAAWWHPVAHERLGRLYQEMGRSEDAVDAYQRFVHAWEDADAPLQRRVEAAQERLEDLTAGEDAR